MWIQFRSKSFERDASHSAKAKVQSSACPTWLTWPYERTFLLQLVACGGNNRGINRSPPIRYIGMFPALLWCDNAGELLVLEMI
ncbi:uncharacterized [Tachysurus ichikawai]